MFCEEFVTFFAKVKSWSQHALFVWDLICCGKRIASNCARFYRIAECVTARIWLDLHPNTHFLLTTWYRKRSRSLDSLVSVIPAGLATAHPADAPLNAFPLESSAKYNKKAVLSTAIFVLLTHCFVQARQCVLKTKATLLSGFLVAHCAQVLIMKI